jgi:hypothetical protein
LPVERAESVSAGDLHLERDRDEQDHLEIEDPERDADESGKLGRIACTLEAGRGRRLLSRGPQSSRAP